MSLWKAVLRPKPYLDIQIGSEKKFLTRIIERPGLWMTDQEQKVISQDLQSIVSSLNIGDLDYGVIQGSKEAMDRAILTIIYDGKTKRPVAFNALSYMSCHLRGQNQQVVHLGLVIIDPTMQARGFSWILYGLTTFLLFFKNRFKPIWISNVTQVPAIIGLVSENFGNVFPNPREKSRRTFDHLTLGREIMLKYRSVFGVGAEATFDEDRFVIQNAYTGGSDSLKKTYEQAPKHRSEIYNQFAAETLDYNRGDDILQLGQIDVNAFYHYMLHTVPRKSLLSLLYKLGFSFAESYAVPLIHWYSTSRSMGVLRKR